MLHQHGARQLFRARRVGDALLGDDLDVGIVLLDRRLEGLVALVRHVVAGVVEDVADLALLPIALASASAACLPIWKRSSVTIAA